MFLQGTFFRRLKSEIKVLASADDQKDFWDFEFEHQTSISLAATNDLKERKDLSVRVSECECARE